LIVVGNLKLLEDEGVEIGELADHTAMLEDQGKTLVFAAIDGKPLALIGIADELKESAAPVVTHLKGHAIDVWMITGDREKTARAVAKRIGVENVLSQVLPGDKASKVKELQERGRTIAFVGDGINDSPALAQADVGIALGSGTEVSVEAGDIVLVRDDLRDVVAAMQLGKQTVSKIRQGFFWALIYNIILLPIAAGVLYPFTGLALRPEFAGLAMALSSVSVVTNALSLNRFKPDQINLEDREETSTQALIAVDPICKMDVDISTASLMSEYQGKTYYFCNPYCKETFNKNPEEYKDQDIRP
jgi:Cu+-exporting ATPase